MSNCRLPNWNLRHQRREQAEAEEGMINRSSQLQNQQNTSAVPMSMNEVMEITWENGLPSMHGFPIATTKPSSTWDNKAYDTLESIVHQATSHKQNTINLSSAIGKKEPNRRSSSGMQMVDPAAAAAAAGGLLARKRPRSESDRCGRYFSTSNNNCFRDQECGEGSAPAAVATFCRDHHQPDTTMASTWPSSESLRSVKTKTFTDDDSACHDGSENRNEENQTKGETVRSPLTRNSRAAAIHNQSERRRRDKINQKMKALQKLVPNASKGDKASMLDEVIEYLKQLQAQVQMMSVRSMSQMMMPLGMQQQLQLSLLARMGMGIGLGMGMGPMFDINNIARSATHQPFPSLIHPGIMSSAASALTSPSFVMPPPIQPRPASQSNIDATSKYPVPCTYPYNAFLTHQSMNLDLYNKMAALFLQQAKQSLQASDSSLQENHMREK